MHVLAVLDNDDALYQIVYFLHIVTAIAGFGPTFAYPMYGAIAKRRQGVAGEAISAATLDVGKKLEYAIYAVPVFGILLVLLSEDVFEFSQEWITIAFVLYIAGLVVSLGFHQPNLRAMNALQQQLLAGPPPGAGAGGPPPQVAELEARGKKAGMFGGILHLLLALILLDMVFKPGAPF